MQLRALHPSDESLYEAWIGGDRKSGAELVRRYSGPLVNFFRSRVLAEEAEDLMQTTLLRCLERGGKTLHLRSFRAYVFRSARNALIDRRRCQRSVEDLEVVTLIGESTSLPSRISRRREHARVFSALAELPDEERTLLELYYWEELSAAELGEVFDVPEGTVRGRLRKAKRKMNAMLTEQSRSPSAEDPR